MMRANSYLICTTPRAGSNLLCEVLTNTGVAGNVHEYFWNPPFWYEQWSVSDFGSYLDRMLDEGQTPNGVFGMKLMSGHLDEFARQIAEQRGWIGKSLPQILTATFPNLHYIWLTRRDKVRQAISLHRAQQTKLWRSTDVGKVPTVEPAFDYERIDLLLDAMVRGDAVWQGYFQVADSGPLTVVYEDFIRDPRHGALEILEYLRIAVPQSLSSGNWRHQKQADPLSDEWARHYRALKERDLQRLP